MTAQNLKLAVSLASVTALLGCGPAWAEQADAVAMPLGTAASAPTGFVEMCERSPTECLAVLRPTEPMLAGVRTWAGRARWAAVFQTAGISATPAAIAEPTSSHPVAPTLRVSDAVFIPTPEQAAVVTHESKPSTPQDIRALKDKRRKHPRSARKTSPPQARQPATSASPVEVAPTAWPVANITIQALEAVTRGVNRAIRRSSDVAAYGREDVWAVPRGRRATGDCEDYVLAKRRALIDSGVDPAALSIAIVRTRGGETHAVLLVSTTEGEQVLDNLSPWVLPWRAAPYAWLERQTPGRPLIWVRAAA